MSDCILCITLGLDHGGFARILVGLAWTCSAARGITIGADVMTGEWLEWASLGGLPNLSRGVQTSLRWVHSTCQLT
jgi:hypothetical protein